MTEPTEGTDSVPVAADDPAPATGTEPARVPVRKRRSRPAKPKTAAAAAAPEPLEPLPQPRPRLTIGDVVAARYPQLSVPLRPVVPPTAGTGCNLPYLNKWMQDAGAAARDLMGAMDAWYAKVTDRLGQSNARHHARLDAYCAGHPMPPLEDGWVPWPEEATT